ncbi:GNAT family N-acetyltransferase [Consotaella aegiceratis]|uniref:GNAT family N-acetyltransferase n=1 Tax=Consotaella aegiceratis TaxID=3097961 RepID=UPI002F40E0F3
MARSRPYRLDDGSALVDLWRQTWIATYEGQLGRPATDKMLAQLRDQGCSAMISGNDETALCAVCDGMIVGSAIFAERGGTAYLWGMYVHPAFQRQGIGESLLAAVSAACSGRRLEVQVLKTSLAALLFYRKAGFSDLGEVEADIMLSVKAQVVVMGRRLDSEV